jgi:CRP-like cAMP-binding protein
MPVETKYLKNYSCFEDLSDKQRMAVAQFTKAECFFPEHILSIEDEPATNLYLLADGEVEVLYAIGESGPARVDRLYKGGIVGCSALVPPFKYSATTRSLTNIEVLIIDAKALRALMEKDCQIGFSIQQHIIRILLDQIVNLRLGS